MKRYLIGLIVVLSLATCGGTPAPTPDAVATQVAQSQAVAATLTAAAAPTATLAPTETPIPSPTDTSEPTNAPTITLTASPTLSPTPRPTRRPTHTPRPTATPTSLPGIGQAVECDGVYEIVVLDELNWGPFVTSNPPKGEFVSVPLQIMNLQSRTASLSLYSDEFMLAGQLGGQWLEFEATSYGISLAQEEAGLVDWWDDLPPLVPVKTRVMFDVNPQVTNWTLLFAGEKDYEAACHLRIPMQRTTATESVGSTPTPTMKPAATAEPTKVPATPTPAMRLLADSQADFTGGQGQNSWEYLFSEGRDSFTWKQMSFDGSCYQSPFSEEQTRICPDHGAPGAGGDIAWLYKAEEGGKLVFKVTTKKTEAEGDDIEIKIYRHTNKLYEWDLDAGDMQGLAQQFELDVNGGEMFFFTLQVDSTWREFKYDPTLFRVQVCAKE